MSAAWQHTLQAGRVLLIDGGTGTELRRRGVRLDPVAWSGPAALTHFDLLEAVHADFLSAGAEVVTTNTFATSRFVLAAAGCEDRFEAINRAAFEAARRARDRAGPAAAIAGSISCLPPGFDPAGYPGADAERDAYVELTTLLAELGVDLLVLEMMEDVEHASRACRAASETGLPFWLGVSCRFDAARRRLVAYDFPDRTLEEVLNGLLRYSPAAVNVMHTPVDAVPAALRSLESKWSGYRGAYPEVGTGAGPARTSPARLAELAMGWVEAGARILGGCCGATPAHIRALREALNQGVRASGR